MKIKSKIQTCDRMSLKTTNQTQGGFYMESIAQITGEMIQKLFKLNIANGITETWEEMKMIFYEYAAEYIQEQLKELDEQIYRIRKKEWQVEQKNISRKLKCEFGEIKFSRRYYKNKITGSRFYLADVISGIEKGNRIETGLSAKLAGLSQTHSYSKSAELGSLIEISKQTVMKKARQAHDFETEEKPPRLHVKEIHIQTDEAHPSLQKGGKWTTVKLAVVHEERKKHKKKVYLTEKQCFASHKETPTDFWERVSDYIYTRYGRNVKVYIHGDGASWIKTGIKLISGSIPVLDRWHLHKRINQISIDFPRKCSVFQYLRHNDYDNLKVLIDTFAANDEISEELGEDTYKYLSNNREGINNTLFLLNEKSKSCAEGQVSHLLADRISSRPMAWMPEGLEAISQLRMYYKNGGTLKPEHMKREDKKLSGHKRKVMDLKAKVAPYMSVNNIDINQLIPKSSLHEFLKEIAHGINLIS